MTGDREIVEVIARDVMGWKSIEHGNGFADYVTQEGAYVRGRHGFNPLESWADAGMVLGALVKKGLEVEPIITPQVCFCTIRKGGHFQAGGEFPRPDAGPRAISLAAYEWARNTGTTPTPPTKVNSADSDGIAAGEQE